jgi:hypothetical protein
VHPPPGMDAPIAARRLTCRWPGPGRAVRIRPPAELLRGGLEALTGRRGPGSKRSRVLRGGAPGAAAFPRAASVAIILAGLGSHSDAAKAAEEDVRPGLAATRRCSSRFSVRSWTGTSRLKHGFESRSGIQLRLAGRPAAPEHYAVLAGGSKREGRRRPFCREVTCAIVRVFV